MLNPIVRFPDPAAASAATAACSAARKAAARAEGEATAAAAVTAAVAITVAVAAEAAAASRATTTAEAEAETAAAAASRATTTAEAEAEAEAETAAAAAARATSTAEAETETETISGAISQTGTPAGMRLRLAEACRRTGFWQQALDHYLHAEPLVFGAAAASLRHNLALCCLGCGEPQRALDYCRRALEMNPALWQSRIIESRALKQLGRVDEAREILERLIGGQTSGVISGKTIGQPSDQPSDQASGQTNGQTNGQPSDQTIGQATDQASGLRPSAPGNVDARLELASLALTELGDAGLALALAKPLANGDGTRAADARLASLMASLYEREATPDAAERLSAGLRAFAEQHLTLPQRGAMPEARPALATPSANGRKRLRVGLISPQFCCSPVYFFCIGALRLLQKEFSLVMFDRGGQKDWANLEFRAIATDWLDTPHLDSEALATLLARQQLDVLIDLGGWMDPVALRALSCKPAKTMFKWVGGQSATTGLTVFDGMFSDLFHTPLSHQYLYSEPLILLDGGYVSYTPPPYLPAGAHPPSDRLALGVTANPAKVSATFLDYAGRQAARLAQQCGLPVELSFIDRRYRHAPLRARIRQALTNAGLAEMVEMVETGASGAADEAGATGATGNVGKAGVSLRFVTPPDHPSFLGAVAGLDAVLDTFPYTGGLTTVEALSMGVPTLTRPGVLFSERHAFAHSRYAGLQRNEFDPDAWTGLRQSGKGGEAATAGTSRMLRSCAGNLKHQELARAIARHLDPAH